MKLETVVGAGVEHRSLAAGPDSTKTPLVSGGNSIPPGFRTSGWEEKPACLESNRLTSRWFRFQMPVITSNDSEQKAYRTSACFGLNLTWVCDGLKMASSLTFCRSPAAALTSPEAAFEYNSLCY